MKIVNRVEKKLKLTIKDMLSFKCTSLIRELLKLFSAGSKRFYMVFLYWTKLNAALDSYLPSKFKLLGQQNECQHTYSCVRKQRFCSFVSFCFSHKIKDRLKLRQSTSITFQVSEFTSFYLKLNNIFRFGCKCRRSTSRSKLPYIHSLVISSVSYPLK